MASSSGVKTVERGAFGPIGASSRKLRLRHLATVFRLRPYRAASSLSEAFDRCIAARMARGRGAVTEYLAHNSSRNAEPA